MAASRSTSGVPGSASTARVFSRDTRPEPLHPDVYPLADNWSDLEQTRAMPEIDAERLARYRQMRIRDLMDERDVALCVLTSPVSQRYAVGYRNYALFTAHIPSTYLFFAADGPSRLFNAFAPDVAPEHLGEGVPISFMYGGDDLERWAEALVRQTVGYLDEIGQHGGRVALEYINPSVTLAFERAGIEVVDAVPLVERARMIKSADEVNCIRWAIAVAELGASKVAETLRPGVTEVQLWALLNYTNLANDGDWHDGRMLASGPRINPWLQEASKRRLEAGDLLGFDTDMVGPLGYCADLSRTLFCGPGRPSGRQRELYRLAMTEIEHNLALVRAGVSFEALQRNAWEVPEEFQAGAYPCILHGVGMCDEFPHIHPRFRGKLEFDGELQSGMVVCIESYIGASGERDGVKLEQQVLVTDNGYELLTQFPYDERLAG